MKQEEKTKLTKEKILTVATKEFGMKSYEGTSLNVICHDYNISKGLIYHNFKNKDELYLVCLKNCYEKMIEHLKQTPTAYEDAKTQIAQFLSARQTFFDEFPDMTNLFFQSMFMPPKHLLKEIEEIKREYNVYIKERYQKLLSNLQLKSNITLDQAVNYMLISQEMYNRYFQYVRTEERDMQALIDMHEEKILSFINLLLYGIVETDEHSK